MNQNLVGSGTKCAIFIEDLPLMLPTKFLFIWSSDFRGEDFLEIDQSETKNCLWLPCLLMDRDEITNLFEDLP
jgi:hypothetical protein